MLAIAPFLLAAAAALVPGARAQAATTGSICVGTPEVMCINATVSATTTTYEVESKFAGTPGWMAIGFGTQMVNTPMYIMWINPDGVVTLSHRQASARTMPTVVANPVRAATLSTLTRGTRAKPIVAFTVPNEAGAAPPTTQSLIWAMSDQTPPSNAVDAPITKHNVGKGTAQLLFGGAAAPPPAPGTTTTAPPGTTTSAPPANTPTPGPAAGAATGRACVGSPQYACIEASRGATTTSYTINILGDEQPGWFSVGFGSSMVNTPMVMFWKRENGTIAMSHRKASSRVLPPVDPAPPRVATLDAVVSTVSEAKHVYAFSIPNDPAAGTDMIWAASPDAVTGAGPTAVLTFHSLGQGKFTMNLAGGAGGPGDNGPAQNPEDSAMALSSSAWTTTALCAVAFAFYWW